MEQDVDLRGLSVALLSGTGRMGVHLAAAWAHAGMDVRMCSRSKDKAQLIVDALRSGQGYSAGDIMVPRHPCELAAPQESWRLRAGSVEDAASADVIVLASPFHVMWRTLEPLVPLMHGRSKIFIDLTNPWLNSSAPKGPYGAPIPPIPEDEPQASVLFHKERFNDPTASWCHAYRHVFWMLIHPTGPNPRCGERLGVELLGDPRAVEVCAAMIEAHGFKPVVRSGGCAVAPLYEISLLGRREKGPNAPPAAGSDPDGLIGPFSASPMIAVDTLFEKVARHFR
jgi:predicted dinucleotide-binding enzyme